MPPSDFREARRSAAAAASSSSSASASSPRPAATLYCATVDGRPYLPTLTVDTSSTLSVARAVAAVVRARHGICDVLPDDDEGVAHEVVKSLTVGVVGGGITNSLFRVSGLRGVEGAEEDADDSALVRVFGAEGMIDRDVENSTLAALCDQGIASPYLGRFSNGRLEGWLDGYRPLTKADFADRATSDAIAAQMARLHGTFVVPEGLREHHDAARPGMWSQLHSWMDQARSFSAFRTAHDTDRARRLDLSAIGDELTRLERDVVPSDARVAFCHNDLLAANVMKCNRTGRIQLIDFEYGGTNFVAFDIANHFNEHAGGTTEEENGVPDYGLFPNAERRKEFVAAYVRAAREGRSPGDGDGDGAERTEREEIESLLKEVGAFVLANHLYWGLWAVNQAAMEGCDDFDYLTYAERRFGEYYRGKAAMEEEREEDEKKET